MEKNELFDIIHLKNEIIIKQTRRIQLLEEKLTELRQKYFKDKYAAHSLHDLGGKGIQAA